MPLVSISLGDGKSDDYRGAVAASVHRALVETFASAENDRMQIMTRSGSDVFRYDPKFAEVGRSADLVLIQVTAADTRSALQKRAFYRRVAELLGTAPGIGANDIVISLIDVPKENWFFGTSA